ncbi:MAG: histidine triad nucleotide-binding protein [Alcanivoracaceae bacterium]|nr:histidine triad nucleotide-binding protein [Alcanivoracaceae bacterium]
MELEPTIFDKIINKEIPADIVFENDCVLAFKDINPQAPVHVLFIPKLRINTINDLKDDQAQIIGELFLAARDYAKQITEDENGYRVIMNCNENGQQSVFHIHLHFMAGRQMQWPPG